MVNRRGVWLFLALFYVVVAFCGCGGSGGGGGLTSGVIPTAGKTQVLVTVGSSRIYSSRSTAVTVYVKDEYGRAVSDKNVMLSALLGGELDPVSGSTENGYFYSRYTAGPGAGTEGITAMALGNVGTTSIIISSQIATPGISIVTGASRVGPGKKTTIAVFVSSNGEPVPEADVSLSSSIGGEFGESKGVTDKAGWYVTTYTAPENVTAQDSVSVLSLGVATQTIISIANQAPASLTAKLKLFPDAVFTGQACLVSVILTDANGNPANADVSLVCDYSGKWDDNSKESYTATVVNGFHQTDFTAGKEVGSATISVNSFNGILASAVLSIEKPTVKVQLSMADTKVKRGNKLPLSVFVSDELLRPYTGMPVQLTSSLGGVFKDNSDSTISGGDTNDNGIFIAFFEPGNTSGTTILTAYSEGTVASKSVLIW